MNFIKKMLSYGVANMLSKFITFLILPIYTNWLIPDDYGQADLAYTMAGLLVSLAFFEIWVGLLRFIADKKLGEDTNSQTYTAVFCVSLLMIIPYCILQSVAGIFIGPQYSIAACLYGISHYYKNTEQYLVRGRKKTNIFIISGLITSLGQLGVAYLLVRILHFGANSVLIAPTVGNFLAIVFMELTTRNYKLLKFKKYNKALAKEIVMFAAPLSVNSLAFWAMNNINKFFAAGFLGYDASSYITVAAKLTMVLTLITSVFTLAWQESTFESSNDKNRGIKYKEMSIAYLYIFTSGTIVFMFAIATIFPYYIGEEYHASYSIVPLYFGSVYFSGLSAFFGTIFGAEKMTKKLMFTTVIGTIVNVVLVFASIWFGGLIVIPICACLGNFVCMLVRYNTIKKKFELGVKVIDLIVLWSSLAISLCLAYIIKDTIGRIIATVLSLIILVIICYIKLYKNSNILKSILKKY